MAAEKREVMGFCADFIEREGGEVKVESEPQVARLSKTITN